MLDENTIKYVLISLLIQKKTLISDTNKLAKHKRKLTNKRNSGHIHTWAWSSGSGS